MIDEYINAGDEPANLPQIPFPESAEGPPPTRTDYEAGFFVRYFARQKNTSRIFEVSEQEFEVLGGNRFLITFSLPWKISGPRKDVFNDAGFPIETGVEDTNRRVLEDIDQRGIEDKLDDLLEYWDGRDRNPPTT
jgi:hypothetical protein